MHSRLRPHARAHAHTHTAEKGMGGWGGVGGKDQFEGKG